jgi:glycosyltransferase involved in cell wall biosynthesis
MAGAGPSGLWIVDHADIAGGGQRFALRLARYASERAGLAVRVVCPAHSALAGWCLESGLAVTDADFPPFEPAAIPRMPAALQGCRRILEAVRPEEVIVANSARVQAYLFAATRVRRARSHVVNVMHEQDSALRPSARFAYRRFGSLLVIGDAAAAAYRRRLPGLVVHEANNFLLEEDLAGFQALREQRIARDGPMVLGTLGRLIPEKGLVELVGELAADPVRPLWARLILAAFPQDEAYERRLRARIGELGLANAVELVGPRPAPAVLADVDALLVPSVGYEAQPTVILEALAAGVPVIVRSPLWSAAYQDLPVLGYGSTDELAVALGRLPLAPAPPSSIADRFGPEQFMTALETAA